MPLQHKIATFTGRLVSYKGLPLLLQVWQEIQRNHTDATLLLVGSGGLDIHNCEAGLKAFVKDNGLQHSVHFAGSVHIVHEYLQSSDLFVFPTEREAFGISVIEAMACGLPVISTSVGGLKDIIQHGQNGLVVAPGSFRQLYLAMEKLLVDPDLAARLSRMAHRSVQEKYAGRTVTASYVELFCQISRSECSVCSA